MLRRSLRQPIPEIETAAQHLDDAVTAHLQGERALAEDFLRKADSRVVWEWLESVWGKTTDFNRPRRLIPEPAIIAKGDRAMPRDATRETKRLVHRRDGFYCRFCKIPVIRGEIRDAMRRDYPDAVPWGQTNATQHAAFQLMWAQYDHIVPHSRGGNSEIGNVYLTCAACNFGRGNYLIDECDLYHPNAHWPRQGPWDGLERFTGNAFRPPDAARESHSHPP